MTWAETFHQAADRKVSWAAPRQGGPEGMAGRRSSGTSISSGLVFGYGNSTTAKPSQGASCISQLGQSPRSPCGGEHSSHVTFPPAAQIPGPPSSGLTPGRAPVEAPVGLQTGQLLLHSAPAAAAVQSASLQHLQCRPTLLVSQQGVVASASQALSQSAVT